MVRLIALIISIVLQIMAAVIALRFMKLTKYRLSWILLSLSFVFMAIRKLIQLYEYVRGTPSFTWQLIDDWIGVLETFMIITGVILIREIFYSLKRAEFDRSDGIFFFKEIHYGTQLCYAEHPLLPASLRLPDPDPS